MYRDTLCSMRLEKVKHLQQFEGPNAGFRIRRTSVHDKDRGQNVLRHALLRRTARQTSIGHSVWISFKDFKIKHQLT